MVPVIDMKKIREFVANQTPAERKANQVRTTELLKAALESDERYRQLCKEKGIQYVPAVAHTPHPMAKYSR